YPTELQYTIFAIPALDGFSGNSNGFIDSYIDVSAYKGEDIMIRFRFGTYEPTEDVQSATNFAPDNAWFVDDIDLIDLITYDTEACITGDTESGCSGVKETIIDASLGTSSEDIALNGFNWNIYPNPAQDFITLTIESDNGFDAEVSMFSMEGKLLTTKGIQVNGKRELVVLNTSNLNEGMYVVQLNTGSQVFTKKVMIH
ncbi:MAG: T9SS type A sorting domain-containing protein, partial [Saprospiraceae bacterium]|nr:T9SS type A sorting domain-containing protein [Saprospiraceae bacterium]